MRYNRIVTLEVSIELHTFVIHVIDILGLRLLLFLRQRCLNILVGGPDEGRRNGRSTFAGNDCRASANANCA